MRSTDALRVLRLMADVAMLRTNPVLQRQHLIDALNAILGTSGGWLFAIDNYRPGRTISYRAQLLTTDADPLWVKYITEFGVKHPITDDPYAAAILHDPRRHQIWTLDSVFPDDAARQRFASVYEMVAAMNVTDGIVGAVRMGHNRDNVRGFSLHCMHGEPPLGKRGHDIARLAITEIGRLIDTGAMPLGPPAPNDLPPRLQQMLVRLMDGRSAKEIASELSLSVHTVREHLQRLYVRYDVASRDELMAKFVGRSENGRSEA